VDVKGEILELKNTINTMVDQLRAFASEVTRVAREVGTEGRLGGQAEVKGVAGTWKDLTDSVNFMASNLTGQVRNIAEVTKAVATGDLSKKITVDVKGEILELKNTVNTMVDQLSSFAAEVTRVAREVGTEGKLGGQAQVKGVSGTWKDLTDNVNFMAGNLTGQVRGIARVVTAVANGDLKQKLTVEAKGEIAALADTINSMIDTLATFADQVTTVAREVGVEGKLGGQASVPGAAGTWKDLTDNVNQLAANLTTQVRAIAEVATAVTKGDLTRSIKVEAQGEVAALKDNINEMIVNLKDTTLKNAEQDWLKTNLAKFSRMLQGQKNMITVGRLILSELAPLVSAHHAVMYTHDALADPPCLALLASYAYDKPGEVGPRFALGEGLVGQCAIEKQKILLTNVPENYIRVSSGLGCAAPANVMVLPIVFEGQVKAVLELASFEHFNPTHQAFLDQLTESIGIVLNTIEANMRTEDLLTQSQSLAQELQSRQEELQQTNQQLQEKAQLLAHQNVEVERKNQEVEQARQALEEKAEQLALTSKYKSEFLANMSHELRTPLNSLLILSDQLSKNPDGNLTPKQTEYCKTIHSSGNDLLMLINDILDLSKIESGTVVLDVGELRFLDLHNYVDRTFRHVAEAKGVDFAVELDPGLQRTLTTDSKRLQQIIKNLLSNAFKFTHRGQVSFKVYQAAEGWYPENESLSSSDSVIAFAVTDTGIGISAEKQQIIFEAFQQADGSTSRKYGGTGLGLAISREIARLLGGEIRLASQPGIGSTFTLFLPAVFTPPKVIRRAALARTSTTPSTQPSPAKTMSANFAPDETLIAENEFGDDRSAIHADDRVLLIVDNDLSFAQLILDHARKLGFKGIIAPRGASAIALASDYRPHAVLLDISLPDIDGWRVLDRLKHDPTLQHIPVYVVSTIDQPERGLKRGARGVLGKPIQTSDRLEEFLLEVRDFVDCDQRRVVMANPNDELSRELEHLFAGSKIEIATGKSVEELADLICDQPVDAVVVVPDAAGTGAAGMIDAVLNEPNAAGRPIYLYLPPNMKPEEVERWRITAHEFEVDAIDTLSQLATVLVRSTAVSIDDLAEPCQAILRGPEGEVQVLAGKKVMIVDDDMRNIFALSSTLERQDIVTVSAETGRDAINLLQAAPDVDIVLMDIMMPEMDGIDTMKAIRQISHFKGLPIIAVTAKAMKGDREKCIEAGAWDYLSKPVNPEQLLTVLRAWLTV
jgi:signal transduction histidine kinase/DNA-binding response OmpR family regulator/HAMP domain-containing protein